MYKIVHTFLQFSVAMIRRLDQKCTQKSTHTQAQIRTLPCTHTRVGLLFSRLGA